MTANPPAPASSAARGRLNGLTILRYAHASGSTGGIEQFLLNINRALGERNQFTTVQVEDCQDRERLAETAEHHGGCRLIKVPLYVEAASRQASISGKSVTAGSKLKSWLVGRVLCAPPVYGVLTRHYLRRHRIPRRPGEPEGAGRKARELMKRFGVGLVVIHSGGGADASEVIAEANGANVPVILVHHFANNRLASLSMSQQVSQAAGVLGFYDRDVPAHLRPRFHKIYDGIDTEFYRSEFARPLPQKYPHPVLFLLSRITPAKGQADLLRVASLLKKRGLPTTVVLAGRVDSPAFEQELRQLADREGLAGQVEFIGEIDAQRLRDWYASARVLVFPTRHYEATPRVLLEGQCMGLPPVVYDIGGTPESLAPGESGLLVPLGNVRRMADAVGTLLKNDSLHAAMSRAGRTFVVSRFNLTDWAERHEEYYLKILHGHGNGAS